MPADTPSDPNADVRVTEVHYEFTPALPEILAHLQASLMVTTYQAGKLLVLGVHDGELKISFNSFDQPMGLAIADDRMALGTRRQMHHFQGNRDVAPSIQPAGTFDLCWVPRESTNTGSIHGHDLAWGQDGLWVVNTLFSCLCTLHENYSFVPRWKPPFISRLIDEDRCHLNGLAIVDGRPRFVTAMSETDTAAGWRPTKATSGVVIEVESGATVARGLAMPHSPRWHDGRLWVLDSGRGALCVVDPASGRIDTAATFPGYTRGLSFLGRFAFVGLSKIRETSVFGGVPIAEHRDELKCGVGVVDLTTCRTIAVFQFRSGVTEIFAVEAATAARCPLVAGASADGQERDVWIVPPPGSVPRSHAAEPWYSRGAATASPSDSPAATGSATGTATTAASVGTAAAANPASPAVVPADPIAESPRDAAGWINLGNLRQEQARQPEALTCYERALELDPNSIPARQNLGYLQFNQGLPERARETLRELVDRQPTPMNRLLAASVLPVVYESAESVGEWRDEQLAALRQLADDGLTVDATTQQVPTAFFWAYQGANDREIMAARGRIICGRTECPSPPKSPDGRIRVGFLSAYLRNHTIGRLNVGRIEQLDRSQFEVTVCAATPARDDFAQRLRRSADRFVEIPRDVPTALQRLTTLPLDILIFCDVGMDALCSTLAFSRVAPVQCVTWGHPDTTGSPVMDAFLSSELLDTPAAEPHYTEPLVRMPLTGTYYERPQRHPDPAPMPRPDGVPESAHLYACPQSLFKFHPDFDAVLRQILDGDPNGHVVGIEGRVPEWTRRLRQRWERTIPEAAERIHLLPALPNPEFLQLLAGAAVVLDPLHFGGGNSSYETFAYGTPVVTLPGEFLRSRITAALYRRMGLTELIAQSTDDYVDRAIRWGTDPQERAAVSRRIHEQSPILFSNSEEVRCLERTLRDLHERAAC